MSDVNRMIMRFEQMTRQVNRELINPQIKELSLEDLRPMAEMVGRARAAYLKELFDLSVRYKDKKDGPTLDEIASLELLRRRFDALVQGSKSVETAIQRGYLDLSL